MSKKLFLRIFFVGEIIFFSGRYLFGANGIKALKKLQQENAVLEEKIAQLTREVGELSIEQKTREQYACFYQEEYARKNLQMAYPQDELYYY